NNILNTFFKLKSGSTAVCDSNIFKTEHNFLQEMLQDNPSFDENNFFMTHYSASTYPELPCNITYINNEIDTHFLDNTLAQNYIIENISIRNNSIKCKYYKGTFLTVCNRIATTDRRVAELVNNSVNIVIGGMYSTP